MRAFLPNTEFPMTDIVIVFHSGYGHTAKVAAAVAEGNLPEGGWEQLQAARAIVFGTPTYMGSVSWQFKKFADASSKAWFTQKWKNKLAAAFTNSASMNGDKLSTLHYLFTLSQQHAMLWVGTGMMPSNSKAATRDDINYVASSSGLMTATPSDASVDEMVAGDIATAKVFGERLKATVAKFA